MTETPGGSMNKHYTATLRTAPRRPAAQRAATQRIAPRRPAAPRFISRFVTASQ